MKINHYGKAQVWTDTERGKILRHGFRSHNHKTLFLLTLYTGCRISEAVQVRTEDIYIRKNELDEHDELRKKSTLLKIIPVITFRRETTKGKTRTRTVPTHPELEQWLLRHTPGHEWVFPGRTVVSPDGIKSTPHMTTRAADQAIRRACERCGLRGFSTHSGRRTFITRLHAAGVGLKTIQDISGHATLSSMQVYIDVTEDQKAAAIATL